MSKTKSKTKSATKATAKFLIDDVIKSLQVTTDKVDDTHSKITVTASAQSADAYLDGAYNEARKYAPIPGFRKGKAPNAVLDNAYGQDYFTGSATEKLIETTMGPAADIANIAVIGEPIIEEKIEKLVKSGEPYEYTFKVAHAPIAKLKNYTPIEIELSSVDVTDDEIEHQIEHMLDFYATNEVDKEGNTKKVLPKLTDVWVKENLDFDSVKDFRNRVTSSIKEQKEGDLPMLKEALIAGQLTERLTGGEPSTEQVALNEQEAYRSLFEALQKSQTTLDAYLQNMGKTSEEFRTEMHDKAEYDATVELALDAFARHDKTDATEEELLDEFKKAGLDNPEAQLTKWRQNGGVARLKQGIIRTKTLQKLVAEAVVKTAKVKPAKSAKK